MISSADAREFIGRLFVILRMGVDVGIVEGMYDEDWESGETFFRMFTDRQFRLLDGKIYCKGGSVVFPPPAIDDKGWEVEPVHKCLLGDIVADGSVHTVYAVVDGQKVQLWTSDKGWDNSKKFLNTAALQKVVNAAAEEPVKETKGVMPLTFLAGAVARNHRGILAMREYEYTMDYETRNHVFTSPSWWLPL